MTSSGRPQGYTAATPWIIGTDTRELLAFMTSAFGATEVALVPNADGSVGHAEARIGDAIVMGFDRPKGWPPTPAFIRLFVADADAAFKSAVAAGAEPITDVTLLAFGDRVGRVRDPFGNVWWLQTHVEDVGEDEMAARGGDPKWAKSMAYAQATLVEALGT